MSVPLPPTDLEGHCSAINDGTLYVLSPTALQSLPVQQHANWTKQPLNQGVIGPACVTAATDGDASGAAMYVIGGQTNDSSFGGLQRFFFGNKTWETLSPSADVLAGRFNHSATYLNDSQSILVYAGSQASDPSFYSSQTFVVSTQPPYNILSFNSKAPPGNLPILQPWNSSHAVMMGGSSSNTEIWLFGPENGWHKLSTELSQPLQSSTRTTLVELSNGAKVLQVYNMSASPNTVTDVVLLGAGGKPAKTGQLVGQRSSSRKRKRELTIAKWPSYNNTNAPTATRADCAIAQDANGLVAITGGDHDSPVVLFNQTQNSWVNAGQYFDDPAQQPLQPSSTPTSTPTPSPSAAPTSGDSAHERTMRTLGISLGVVLGVAAIFIVILLLLRRRKLRQRKMREQQAEKDGEDRMSFADRGASFMKEAGVSLADLAPPPASRYDSSRASNSSLAIIAGKFSNRRSNNGHAPATSFDSTAQLVKDTSGNLGAGEPVEMVNIGEKPPTSTLTVPGMAADGKPLESDAKARRKRSSGWSKYFATSQPNRLSHLPSAYAKSHSVIYNAENAAPENPSQPSASRAPSLVPPIDTDVAKVVDGQRVSHVPSSSPSYSDSREDLALRGSNVDGMEGQKGTIVDLDAPRKSQSNSVSSYGNRSTLSSNITGEFYNETSHTPWTPTSNAFNRDPDSRPTSSIYTASVDYGNRRPSRGKSAGFFPGHGTSYRPPPKTKMSYAAGPTSEWAAPPKLPFVEKATDRDSSVTVFPSGLSDTDEVPHNNKDRRAPQHAPEAPKPANTDMSWLNLDLNQEHA